jgi:hypothetical protein
MKDKRDGRAARRVRGLGNPAVRYHEYEFLINIFVFITVRCCKNEWLTKECTSPNPTTASHQVRLIKLHILSHSPANVKVVESAYLVTTSSRASRGPCCYYSEGEIESVMLERYE